MFGVDTEHGIKMNVHLTCFSWNTNPDLFQASMKYLVIKDFPYEFYTNIFIGRDIGREEVFCLF